MANTYNAVTLTGSAAPLQATLNSVVADLNNLNAALETVKKQTVSYNAAAKETTVVTERMLDANTKVTETAITSANGNTKFANSISVVTNELKKQEQATRDLARANAETALRTALPVPSSATVGQLVAYQNQLNSILNLMSTGKVNAQQFSDVLAKAASGNKDLSGFTSGMSQAFSGVANLAKGLNNANDEADKLDGKGKEAGLSWKNIFNIGEALIFKQILAQITQELAASVKGAVALQIQIAQIRTISQESQSTFSQWNSAITNVSNKLGLDVKDVGAAAYESLSNQTTKGAADTEKFLMTAGEFARTTVSSTKDSVNLLTSAFNAFKIPVEDAEKVAATFFKTIDLGRIKASELGNSFGRIAQPAAAIGVTFEETAAALTTLTRQGVTAHDAQTQLLNVFTRLLKPTGDLKALMESWGTPTAEAAIATFSFAGVLKKLEEAAKGSSTELANLFPDIRGLRGIGGLTQGGLFDQYTQDLGKIKNASADYDLAKVLRAEPAADTLIKEFERVKNFFINDFGQALLNTGKQINDLLGDMSARFKSGLQTFGLQGVSNGFSSISEGLQTITKLGYAAIEMWLIYKTAQIAVTAVTITYTSLRSMFVASEAAKQAALMRASMAMNGQAVAATAATISTRALLVASVAYLPIIAAVGAGLYLLSGQFDSTTKSSEAMNDSVARLQDITNKQGSKKRDTENQQAIDAYKVDSSKVFDPALKILAQGVREANTELDTLSAKGKEVGESLAGSFSRYTDALKAGIATYTDKIKESQRAIDKQARTFLSLDDTIDQVLGKFARTNATERQQVDLEQQQINNMKAKAAKLIESGDINDLTEYERLLKEIINMEGDLAQRRFEIKKREDLNLFNIDQARQSPQAQQATRERMIDRDVGSSKFGQAVLPVDSTKAYQDLKQKTDDLRELGRQGRERAKTIQDDLNKTRQVVVDDAKTQLEAIQRAYKELQDFSIYDKDGKTVKKEFQKSPSDHSLDEGKADKARQAIVDRIQNNVPQFTGGRDLESKYFEDLYNKQLEFFANIEAKKTSVYAQELSARRKADAEDQQLRVQQLRTKMTEELVKAQNAPTEIRKQLGGEQGPLRDFTDPANAIKKMLADSGRLSPSFGREAIQTDQEKQNIQEGNLARKYALQQADDIEAQKKIADEMIRNGATLQEIQPILERIKTQYAALLQNLDVYYQARLNQTGTPTDQRTGVGNVVAPGGQTIDQLNERFGKAMEAIQKGFENIDKNTAKAAELKTAIESRSGTVGYAEKTLGQQVVERFAVDVFGSSAPLPSAASDLAARMRTITQTIDAIKAPAAQQNIPTDQSTGNPYEQALALPGFNEGGIVGGKPGIDQNIVRLTRGELVVPVNMVPTFLPMFQAMQLGRTPYGAGGNVSTTVGDINITVQGPMTPDKTIRQIGEQLRREVRRGNVILS